MSALIQGTPEWLEMRKTKVGASDAPIIMGDSIWTTPFELWQEKVGLKKSQVDNFAMSEGRRKEPIARDKYQLMTGILIKPKVVFHADYAWMMASLDGCTELGQHIVEIKCPGIKDHDTAKKGKAPQKYYAQLQHQLAVTGLNMVHYFSFYDNEGIIVEVLRDDKYIAEMMDKEMEFMRCVDQLIPPPITQKEERQALALSLTAVGAERLAARYFELSSIIDDLTAQKEDYKKQLIALSGGSDLQGKGFKLSKIITKGRLDYETILRQNNIDIDLCHEFRKPNFESWRITKDE